MLSLRVPPEVELMAYVTNELPRRGIRYAFLYGLGAFRDAVVAWYDQSEKRFVEVRVDRPMEVASLIGNLAERDGAPVAHIHVVLSDRDGKAYGGHLMRATVFNLELFAVPTERPLVRRYSEYHGLYIYD